MWSIPVDYTPSFPKVGLLPIELLEIPTELFAKVFSSFRMHVIEYGSCFPSPFAEGYVRDAHVPFLFG